MESFAADLARLPRTPLSGNHVTALRAIADEVTWPAGHVVVNPGDRQDSLVYIVEGAIEVFDPLSGEAYLSSHLGPGQFTGEIGFLNGTAASLALRTRESARVLVAPRAEVLQLMAKIPEMSDILLSVFAARRRRQIDMADSNLTLIAPDADRTLRTIESFLGRNKIPFKVIAMDDPRAATLCRGVPRPGVAFGSDGLMQDPSPSGVAANWDWTNLPTTRPGPMSSSSVVGRRALRPRSMPVPKACVRSWSKNRGRWSGRHLVSRRELPWVSDRDIGRRPGLARRDPGRQIRNPFRAAAASDRA
jgi:hypothetical protein